MRSGGCPDSVESQGRACNTNVGSHSTVCAGERKVAVAGTRAAAAPSRGALDSLAPVPSARPYPCPRSLKCIRWGEMCVWGAYPRATLVPHVYISHARRPRYRVRGSERRVWNCERRVRGPCECRDGGLVAFPGTASVPSAVNAQFSTEAGTTVGAGHCTRGQLVS